MSIKELNEEILEQDDEEKSPLASKQKNIPAKTPYDPLTAVSLK